MICLIRVKRLVIRSVRRGSITELEELLLLPMLMLMLLLLLLLLASLDRVALVCRRELLSSRHPPRVERVHVRCSQRVGLRIHRLVGRPVAAATGCNLDLRWQRTVIVLLQY